MERCGCCTCGDSKSTLVDSEDWAETEAQLHRAFASYTCNSGVKRATARPGYIHDLHCILSCIRNINMHVSLCRRGHQRMEVLKSTVRETREANVDQIQIDSICTRCNLCFGMNFQFLEARNQFRTDSNSSLGTHAAISPAYDCKLPYVN